jgi:TRAP-type C4-dicarboxylate transport system permease small subunit
MSYEFCILAGAFLTIVVVIAFCIGLITWVYHHPTGFWDSTDKLKMSISSAVFIAGFAGVVFFAIRGATILQSDMANYTVYLNGEELSDAEKEGINPRHYRISIDDATETIKLSFR